VIKCQLISAEFQKASSDYQGRVHLTVGNRSGYRGNRSYRSGSVRKKVGYRSLTEPSKPLFSVYRSILPVYRTGFGDLENRSGSGFLNLSLPATEVKTLPTLLVRSKTGGLLDKATGKSEASKSHGNMTLCLPSNDLPFLPRLPFGLYH
jgi:hypothetical protein